VIGAQTDKITANFYSNELSRRKTFLNFNKLYLCASSLFIFLKVEHGFYVGKAIEFISECDIERHFRWAYFCATFTNVEAKNSTLQLKCKIQKIVRINCQGAVDIW
jgi:hypothetical protein